MKLPYLDDIAVFSDSWADHLVHLRVVLSHLRQAGLTVKAEKCCLARATVDYLGHHIGQGFMKPREVQISAVAYYPRPKTMTAIQASWGSLGIKTITSGIIQLWQLMLFAGRTDKRSL